MTSAETRTMYGKTDFTRESQFLREIDRRLMEGDGVYEKKKPQGGRAIGSGMVSDTPFKPFDALKFARQETEKRAAAMDKAAGQAGQFNPGDMVEHKKFGVGKVLACDGKIIQVEFPEGTKKLALGFAPLKKV